MQDVSEKFENCIKAEQDGKNVLILRKLDAPMKRMDGKRASYELEYRWLSNPEHVSSVQGNEFSYYLAKEIDFKKGLFDQFQLF